MNIAQHLVHTTTMAIVVGLSITVSIAAPCYSQGEKDDSTIDTTLQVAVRYAGFSVDEQTLADVGNKARNVTLSFVGRGHKIDTTVCRARCFTFRGVALEWVDGETYVRDYDVLIEAETNRPLLIRSPSQNDSVITDSREDTLSRHPTFNANAVSALDTTVISFSDAILACIATNPLEARQIEAAIIVCSDMLVKSALAWDIVARGPQQVYSSHLSSYPGRVSEETRKIIDERRKQRYFKYVRHYINAVSGESLSYDITAGYEEEG